METKNFKYHMKVVFVGDSTVGKTCLISKLNQGEFMEKSVLSVAPEYYNIVKEVDGEKIFVSVWDTAGQEKFRAVNKIYYKEAKIAFIVYDVTSEKTFNSARDYWIKNVKESIGNRAGMFIYII